MPEPRETRISYLRRVLPDVRALEASVRDALLAAEHGDESDYDLSQALGTVQKLLTDLSRALRVPRSTSHCECGQLVGGGHHHCGVSGYDPSKDAPCPGCADQRERSELGRPA